MKLKEHIDFLFCCILLHEIFMQLLTWVPPHPTPSMRAEAEDSFLKDTAQIFGALALAISVPGKDEQPDLH